MIEQNPVIDDPTRNMDDFQRIKGIGPSIAQALHATGIHRFSDLAMYAAEDLVNLLSPNVGFMTIQRIERDNWLGQARELASVQVEKSTASSEDVEPPSQESGQTSKPKMMNHLQQRAASWREIADFFVSFGNALDSDGEMRLFTRVHHSQADRFKQWDGIAVNQLMDWMLNQANLPISALETEQLEPQDEAQLQFGSLTQSEEEAQVELSDLWVSQVETPATVDGVARDGLLRLESKLSLSGPDALHLTYERIPYNIQVYLIDAETNQSECASIYSSQLSPEELSYTVLQDFPTPKRGRYQVNVIGQLSLPGSTGAIRTIFSYLQGPVLRVGT